MPSHSRRFVLKAGALATLNAALSGAGRGAEFRTVINDASRLNPTPVMRHVLLKPSAPDALIERLRGELKDAAAQGRPFALGVARHSMGGQSIPRDGVAVTLSGGPIEVDESAPESAPMYRVGAGATWAQVIRKLDPLGLSPAVMQSNHDFGVGSTFCVNSHGWPVPHGPFGATVRSVRVMLADGTVLTCSKDENAELFGLAMGGYGLVGIILDLEIEAANNELLAPKVELISANAFGDRFLNAIRTDPQVRMAYGRLEVARKNFFEEALLITYRPVSAQPKELPAAVSAGFMTSVSDRIYRAQIGSEAGKRARWIAETRVNPALSAGIATCNTLMNEPVANLPNRDPRRTDILHEYFVPPERFGEFLAACKELIPPAKAEFINVTLRFVDSDPTSILAYAPEPRIAAVMSFSQEISPRGETDMMLLTERLIERVVGIGGSFYLPYRLHARRDQVERSYPNAARFAERKRHYDPGLVFRNAMWDAYFV
jgi:FAD/FMN-containing dehydrogenase